MNGDMLREIIAAVTTIAINSNYTITIEQRDYNYDSEMMGHIATSKTADKSLIFKAYPTREDEEGECEDE